MPDTADLVDDFFTLLEKSSMNATFPTEKYTAAFQNACKASPCLSSISGSIPTAPQDINFGNDQIDQINHAPSMTILGLCAAARCMADTDDQYGFKQTVRSDVAHTNAVNTVTGMFTACYGDYLNRQLRANNGKDLRDASYDSNFKTLFEQTLLDPPTQMMAKLFDQAQGNRVFTTNLLFAYSYWKQGPGFSIVTDYNAALHDPSSWVYVVNRWIAKVHELKTTDAEFAAVRASNIVAMLSSFSAPNGDTRAAPDMSMSSLQSALSAKSPGSTDNDIWDVGQDLRNVDSMRQVLWNSWDNRINNFMGAVRNAENSSHSSVSSAGMYGTVFATTTVYGDPAVNLMTNANSAGLGALFSGQPNNRIWVNGSSPRSGSCFRPGTKVLTKDGTVSIENVRESLQVLTHGGSSLQYGTCSDEEVRHSTVHEGRRIHLFGFNREQPFVTASHVFHTTTGLRAIDPATARQENPWVQVGQLEVGHSLLHTKDGKVYTPVLINSIEAATADCDFVHGIHMHEGLRSYHADGYLVHANYPEVTVKSLSKLLLAMPSEERLRALLAIKELQPLFAKFGAVTLLDLLDRELKSPPVVATAPMKKRQSRPDQADMNNIVRTWNLSVDNKGGKPSDHHSVPSVSIAHGVVSVGGNYCKIAAVKGRVLTWSRELPAQSQWEHGSIRLDRFLLFGVGSVVHCRTKQCEKPTMKKSVVVTQAPMEEPQHLLDHSEAVAKHVAALQATFTAGAKSPAIDRAVVPGDGSVKHVLAAESVKAATTTTVMPRKGFQYKARQTFALSYDPAEYKDGATTAVNPVVAFTDLILANKPKGLATVVRLKAFDDLRDAIMYNSGISWPRDLELYTSRLLLDENAHMGFEIRFKEPDLIASQADQNQNRDPSQPPIYDNLTYTRLNCSVKIPFVPSLLSVKLNATGNRVIQPSIIRRYDQTMAAQFGARYMLLGVFKSTPKLAAAIDSSSTAAIGGATRLTEVPTGHVAPAPAVHALAAAADPVSLDEHGVEILTSLQLDTTELHKRTQSLLYRAMVYHMDTIDRQTYTNDVQPGEGTAANQVPQALASGLDSRTRSWLRDTYTKAWISQRILNIAPADRDKWQRKLPDSSSARIEYFFTGKNQKCLAKSQSYNRLNELASQAVLISLCPDLGKYLTDPTSGDTQKLGDGDETIDTTKLTGGKRWAAALYNGYALGVELEEDVKTDAGCEKLQKICNFMSVLDPIPIDGSADTKNTPLAIRLGLVAQQARESWLATQVYLGSEEDQLIKSEQFFLYEAMKQLWENLLSGAPGFGGDGDPVKDHLRAEANKVLEIMGEAATKSAADKAMDMADAFQNVIADQAKFIRGVGFLSNVRSGRNRGLGGAAAITEAVVALQTKEPGEKMSKLKMFGYGAMVLATAAMFVAGALSAFRAWPALTDADRSKLILSCLQTVFVMLDSVREAAGPSITKALLKYRPFKNKEPKENIEKDVFGPAEESTPAERDTASAIVEQNEPRDPVTIDEKKEAMFGPENKATVDEALDPVAEREKIKGGGKLLVQEAQVKRAEEIRARMDEESKGEGPLEKVKERPNDEIKPQEGGSSETNARKRPFSIGANTFKILVLAMDLGLAVIIGFQIYQNWNDYALVDKILNIASLVQQTLSFAVEIINVAVDIGAEVAAGLSAFCAIAGPILAIVGIVLLFVMLFLPHDSPRELTEPEKWIENTGTAFVNGLPDPPNPRLDWKISVSPGPAAARKISIAAGTRQSITVVGTNASATATYKFSEITALFSSGADTNNLFSDAAFHVDGAAPPAGGGGSSTGVVKFATGGALDMKVTRCGVASDDFDKDHVRHTVSMKKIVPTDSDELRQDDFLVVVPPGASVSFTLQGTIGAHADQAYRLNTYEYFDDGDVVNVVFEISKA